MAVHIAALGAVCFYIFAIPVNIALVIRITNAPRFGAGFSIFEGRHAFKAASRRSLQPKRHAHRKPIFANLDKQAAIFAAAKAGKCLLRHIHLEKLELRGRLCLSDAARTALSCGWLHSLEGALFPLAGNRISLRPAADFSAGQSDLTLGCMVSLRVGHIMLAALTGAWNYMIRRTPHGKASN